MKKSLIALAALAAVGAASAQSSVTLYGIADVTYNSKTHTNGNGTLNSKTSGIGEGFNAGNRIGFRGVEDLGGGLKAGFTIENGINLTNGALFSTRAGNSGHQVDGIPGTAYTPSTNRQSFISLSSGMGEVRAGYQYTALYTVSTLSGYALGSEQPGGDSAHGVLNAGNYGGTRANGLTYISPNFSGLQVTLQRGAGVSRDLYETATSKDEATRTAILGKYTMGKFNISAAYTSYDTETLTAAVDGTLFQLGASMQLGGLKLAATFADGKTDSSIAGADTKSRAMQVGAEFAMGAARPFAQLGNSEVKNQAGAATVDADTYQIGVRYDLSKRTVAYVMHGQYKDDKAALTAVAKRKATAIGVMHAF